MYPEQKASRRRGRRRHTESSAPAKSVRPRAGGIPQGITAGPRSLRHGSSHGLARMLRPGALVPGRRRAALRPCVQCQIGETVMRHFRLSLYAMAVALLSACASGGMGQTDAGPTAATVVVNNNLTIPTSLTVSLVSEGGSRRLLGNVNPGGNGTLSVSGTLGPGRYRLLARTTGGTELVSDPFNLSEGEQVTWDLQSNIVRVTGT